MNHGMNGKNGNSQVITAAMNAAAIPEIMTIPIPIRTNATTA